MSEISIDGLREKVTQMLEKRDPNQAISASVVFHVMRSQESQFIRNADVLAEATRTLEGVTRFAYHRNSPWPGQATEDSIRYLIYENWISTELFKAQWNSEHLKKFQYSVGAFLTGTPKLKFYGGDEQNGEARPFQTGQKRCWDGEGNLIDCAGTGQDGAIKSGLEVPTPLFTDKGDGTVLDHRSGLIWLKNANSFGELPWEQGLAAVKSVAEGTHGLCDGSSPGDWRVPNINEILSLLDLDSETGAALPKDAPFDNLGAANYWSSSTVAAAPPLGWYCALAVGPPVFDLKINPMRIWPVKGTGYGRLAQTGQTKCYDTQGQLISCEGTGQDGETQYGVPFPTPRYVDNQDGTVTDKLTGLVWLKDANPFGLCSWEDAVASCNKLADGDAELSDGSEAGHWRLPNIKEMRSLIDYDHYSPAIDHKHPFTNVRTSLYWSSTTIASAPNQARFVFVGMGPSVWDHKSVEIGSWPVRDAR